MKLRMIVFTVFIAGCSHGTTSGGTAISSSSAGLSVQASGSTAAALIGLGIAGAVIYRSEASSGALPLASDRKSTRLNSSHTVISYAVFCLKKKKKKNTQRTRRNEGHVR